MASVAQIKVPESALDQSLGNALRTANGLLCTDALALYLSESDTPDAWLGAAPEHFSNASRADHPEFHTRVVMPLSDGRARVLLLWRAPNAAGPDQAVLRVAVAAMLSAAIENSRLRLDNVARGDAIDRQNRLS